MLNCSQFPNAYESSDSYRLAKRSSSLETRCEARDPTKSLRSETKALLGPVGMGLVVDRRRRGSGNLLRMAQDPSIPDLDDDH